MVSCHPGTDRTKCILQKYSEAYSWQVCDGPNIEKNIQKKKKNNPEKTKRDQSSVRRQKKCKRSKLTTQEEHTDFNASAGINKGPGETNEANQSASVRLPGCRQPGRQHTKAGSPVFQPTIT